MSQIEFTLDEHIIYTKGALNTHTVMEALEKIKLLIPSHQSMTIDLQDVVNVDSAGLAFLTAILRYAKQKKTKLAFARMPEKMLDLSRVSGLDVMLTLVES